MPKYKLSPRAQRQMRQAWKDIAVHNEPAADKLLQRLFDKFEMVANHPEMVSARPEISEVARLLIEGRYIAIYDPTDYGAEIVVIVLGCVSRRAGSTDHLYNTSNFEARTKRAKSCIR